MYKLSAISSITSAFSGFLIFRFQVLFHSSSKKKWQLSQTKDGWCKVISHDLHGIFFFNPEKLQNIVIILSGTYL